MIKATELFFAYDDEGFYVPSFSLNSGQVMIIKGANGSGKSTFLKLCAGLLEPHVGRISHCCGNEFWNLKLNQGHIGYMGQDLGLDSMATVEEVFSFSARLQDHDLKEEDDFLDELLSLWELGRHNEKYIDALSQGQKARVALCRLLVERRPGWVLDEPFSSLDQKGRSVLGKCLLNHVKAGGWVIVSTHEANFVEIFNKETVDYKVYEFLPGDRGFKLMAV